MLRTICRRKASPTTSMVIKLASPADPDLVQGPDRGVLNASEGREVMPAHQVSGGVLHGLGVEAFIEFVDIVPSQWPAWPGPDAVAVLPPRRSATRVEVCCHPL